MRVAWEPIYSVNVEELDEQHKKLIDFINDAYTSLDTDSFVFDDFADFYPRLVQHAVDHFATEERYFKEFGFEGAPEHIQKHDEIKAKTTEFSERFLREKSAHVIFETLIFLDDWIFVHIMEYDKKYMKCFNEHGLK